MLDQPCLCLICTGRPPGRDAQTAAIVRRHGWSALGVPGSDGSAYTIGLWHTFRLPEVAMFGLPIEGMQHWLNTCVGIVREHGWPEPGEPFRGVIDGFDTQLRPVDESWRDAFFGTADRFYRGWPVPVWQLVWPDRNGRWLWDEHVTVGCRFGQPAGWLPVHRHPAGRWRLQAEFADGFPLPAEPDDWALTSRAIIEGRRAPSMLLYDRGQFDVLDDRGHGADDLCQVHLGALVQQYEQLVRVGDLQADAALTAMPDGGWRRAELSDRDRAASAAAWPNAPQVH